MLCLLHAGTLRAQNPGDLVVGFPNPNEVRVIDTPLDVDGNVIVVNNGTLRLNGTQLRIRGDLVLLHNGRLDVQGGSLAFVQDYLYQRGITLANTSALWLNGSVLNCGGYNLDVAVTDTAVLRYDGSSVTAGLTTTVLNRMGSVEANNSEQLGEFLYFDQARGSFAGCTNLLTWLTLPSGSTLATSLPGSQVLDRYVFPDSAQAQSGFAYRTSFEGSVGLRWGLMLEQGCDATLRDSDLLVVGAMFRGSGAATVNGLVNITTLESARYPADDRNVRFERCRVQVWNLYSFDTFRLTVTNSIFGEIIAFGNSDAAVVNSICDGSGGYMAAFDDASLLLQQSQISARVIARGRGQVISVASTITGHIPHAAGNGVVALFHSSFPGLPTVEAGSVAAVISVDEPRQAPVDARVPVFGSVRFLAGADVPVHFVSYWLGAAAADAPELSLWTSQPSIVQRYRDTIGVWDTQGLTPGDYLLTVHLRLSNGDTISVPAPVRLTPATVGAGAVTTADAFRIEAVYPSPLRGGELLHVRLSDDGPAEVVLHDLLGRERYRASGEQASWRIPTATLPAGSYLLGVRRGTVWLNRHVVITN